MAEIRAMVLAAGLGTRLRPLTAVLPKPLVPVLGVPLVALALELLRRAGVKRVCLNLHHLPERLAARLADPAIGRGLELVLLEEPVLLGTGGGLRNARAHLHGASAVLLVNGDTLVDIDLAALVARHLESGAAATLLVRDNPDPQAYPPVEVDVEGRVRRIAGRPAEAIPGPETTPRLFAGIHVLAPWTLDLLADGVSDVNRALHPLLIERGERVLAVHHAGLWSDVGTPGRLLAANLAALAGAPAPLRELAGAAGLALAGDSAVAGDAALASGASVRAAVVGAGARIGAGARVEQAVLLPGVSIGEGARVRQAVLGPGETVAPGEDVSGELRAAGGRAAPLEAER